MKRWLVAIGVGTALLAGGAVAVRANDTAIGGAGGTVGGRLRGLVRHVPLVAQGARAVQIMPPPAVAQSGGAPPG